MKKLSARFVQLLSEIESLEKTKTSRYDEFTRRHYEDVDRHQLLQWKIKAKNLLEKACGQNSVHLSGFADRETASMYQTNLDVLKNLKAVFIAAQDDYGDGYLVSATNLVAAELFDDQLGAGLRIAS